LISFLENWSSGLHRVIFYGDHTQDMQRYCGLPKSASARRDDEPQQAEGLDWDPHVHA